MSRMIRYDWKRLILSIKIGKYQKYLQCPFATWWKARKYFKRPRFKVYFGPMQKKCWYEGNEKLGIESQYIYEEKGFMYFASYNYIKRSTSKWFPILMDSHDIAWKDKYDTPRYEHPGFFSIIFGRNVKTAWQFVIVVKAPKVYCSHNCTLKDHEENYWESILWYLHYADQYNTLNRKQNLFKARNTMQCHWSMSKQIDIKNSKILEIGEEILSMGDNKLSNFIYFDVKSDNLVDLLNSKNIYSRELASHTIVLVKIRNVEKIKINKENKPLQIGQDIWKHSYFIKILNDFTVRIYVKKDSKLNHILKKKKYGKIDFTYDDYIDLGPAFKDDFLNKNGIKEIYVNNKAVERASTN